MLLIEQVNLNAAAEPEEVAKIYSTRANKHIPKKSKHSFHKNWTPEQHNTFVFLFMQKAQGSNVTNLFMELRQCYALRQCATRRGPGHPRSDYRERLRLVAMVKNNISDCIVCVKWWNFNG